MAKVKEFQKCIVDDVDFKDTISGDHVCACPCPRARLQYCRLPGAKHPATCQRLRVPCAVVEAHQSWSGPCECVKPMLYRISLDKEDIKFCTAASDKVCRSAFVSVRVARRGAASSCAEAGFGHLHAICHLCLPDRSVFGADCSAQGPQGQSEASLFVLQGELRACRRAPPSRPLPAPCGWGRESRGLQVPRTDGTGVRGCAERDAEENNRRGQRA
jgi:hypothetical protein